MPRSPDLYDSDINSEREDALDARAAKTAREHAAPFAVVKRYATDEDRRESLRLSFESAFTKQVES